MDDVLSTGIVITAARKLEERMAELGATEAGLHAKTDFLAARLSPKSVKLLHYIAAVRNRAAHETLNISDVELADFTEACDVVMRELDGETSASEVLPEAEVEWKWTFDKIWRLSALVPMVHLIYSVVGVGVVLWEVKADFFALLSYGTSLALLGFGIIEKSSQVSWIGLVLLAFSYIYGCLVGIRTPGITISSALIPGFNMIPVVLRFFHRINIAGLIYFTILLSIGLLGGVLIWAGEPGRAWGWWLLSASYAMGLLSALLVSSKK